VNHHGLDGGIQSPSAEPIDARQLANESTGGLCGRDSVDSSTLLQDLCHGRPFLQRNDPSTPAKRQGRTQTLLVPPLEPHFPVLFAKEVECLFNFSVHKTIYFYYLRYHTMDCKSLHENSKNGQYWANASHFLFCNLAHEQVYFFHLRNELKEGGADMWKRFKTIFDVEVKDKVLKVS